MRSRIAIFEGYGASRRKSRRGKRMGFSPEQLPRGYGFSPEELPRGYGFSPERLPRGYGGPLLMNPRPTSYSAYGFSPEELPRGYGGPLLMNPRPASYGRRGYFVSPLYGPARGPNGRKLQRKGYKVKKGRNTKAQVRFKKAAKKCARSSRNKRKGAYQSCMRKALKKKGRR